VTTDLTALPAPIRAYLAAHEGRDDGAAVRTFAPDATVTDEGQTHTGMENIRAWRRGASTEYNYTTEVTGVRQDSDDVWVVAVRLEGNFPGGVADLEQRFTVRDGAIADLTIA
jgi:cell wall assembly regulator SMI1